VIGVGESVADRVSLVPATPADEPALAAFMRQLREDDPEEGPFDEARCVPAILRLLANPSFGRAWIINFAGVVAGYTVLTLGYSVEFGGVIAFVDELFVARGLRGKGIGTRVLQLTIEEARKLDVVMLALEVTRSNESAKRVYRSVGFVDREHHLMTLRFQ
jgi:GNAT superfamily N-acetyltransferase